MTIPETRESAEGEWSKILGPLWTIDRASFLTGLSQKEVADRSASRTLLGCKTQDGDTVFPAFQFQQDKKTGRWNLIEGLDTVLTVFPEQEDGNWTLASWLKTPRPALEEKSIVDYLKASKEFKLPLAIARATADKWAH
jgi:hypothetical protein